MEKSRHLAKVFAIASGKGGVGKTNIAVNLSVCLAASGKRILLFDGDYSLGNVDVVMDINCKYNLWHMLNGCRTLEEVIHTCQDGLEVICGASGLESLADITKFQRHRLLGQLDNLQADYDVIVIDTAAGINKSVIGFCLACDHTLVVATPEAAAMSDAYAMIKVLAGNDYAGRISLIVNMAETAAEGKRTYQQIAKVAAQFLDTQIYNAAVFLKDSNLVSAVRQRKPVVLAYPRSRISSSFVALASRLSSGRVVNRSNEGFLRKVVDWFS